MGVVPAMFLTLKVNNTQPRSSPFGSSAWPKTDSSGAQSLTGSTAYLSLGSRCFSVAWPVASTATTYSTPADEAWSNRQLRGCYRISTKLANIMINNRPPFHCVSRADSPIRYLCSTTIQRIQIEKQSFLGKNCFHCSNMYRVALTS
jgi:hypothetical protein